jgi:hypothetical protein
MLEKLTKTFYRPWGRLNPPKVWGDFRVYKSMILKYQGDLKGNQISEPALLDLRKLPGVVKSMHSSTNA